MEEDFRLIGDFTPTELNDSGITLVAPGLYGRGTWHSRRETGETRAFTGEQGALDQAIAESGAEDRHTLVLEAPTPAAAGGGVRSLGGVADDELLLQVPLAPGEAAVVMCTDEAGVISFHYSQPAAAAAQPELPSRAFGAGQQVQFRLRLRTGEPRAAGQTGQTGQSRGLMGRVAAKVIKVLVVKVFPNQVGSFAARRVQAWEQQYRAQQGLHSGDWAQLLDPRPTRLQDIRPLLGRRSLLLIHGTTSTTAGAFAGLARSPLLLDRLSALYERRVLGFNHHTLSVPVAENVRQLYAALSEAPGEYHFDVICHSRGGLVARALAHLADEDVAALAGSAWRRPANVKLRIGRIVFVATPNAGTALADPPRIPEFVDRLANYVNMLPDAALTVAAGPCCHWPARWPRWACRACRAWPTRPRAARCSASWRRPWGAPRAFMRSAPTTSRKAASCAFSRTLPWTASLPGSPTTWWCPPAAWPTRRTMSCRPSGCSAPSRGGMCTTARSSGRPSLPRPQIGWRPGAEAGPRGFSHGPGGCCALGDPRPRRRAARRRGHQPAGPSADVLLKDIPPRRSSPTRPTMPRPGSSSRSSKRERPWLFPLSVPARSSVTTTVIFTRPDT